MPAQKLYETKQYKKGLKVSDTLLKKHPDHGETLSMRGLILSCLDRKAEAYDYCKRGLSKDIRSHVCWHVFGLVYRSDRDYKEAVKCYRNALRIEPDNLQILRDMSQLQVQLRDKRGFLDTRNKLLKNKATQRFNWVSLALAFHLCGRHTRALDVLRAYEGTQDASSESETAYEKSELALYRVEVLADAGLLERALEALGEGDRVIVDRTGSLEWRAELHLRLGHFPEAERHFQALLETNPEHYGYHAGLQLALVKRAVAAAPPPRGAVGASGGGAPYGNNWGRRPSYEGLTAAERAELLATYAQLQARFPSANAPRRIPLDFLDATDDATAFAEAFTAYAQPLLRKGVPSFFADVRPLYADGAKAAAIGGLMDAWQAALDEGGAFPDGGGAELPCVGLWVRFFRAQHKDALGDVAGALEEVARAVAHSPTLIDLYTLRARIFKHAGSPGLAAGWMDYARRLDLADRYLNTKATKYHLLADDPAEAARVVSLFTKEGPDPETTLYEMQCAWYEVAAARSFLRTGEIGRCLQKTHAVDKHFEDMVEDQFDFHTYCVRKMTLRAYLQLLRVEVSAAPGGVV